MSLEDCHRLFLQTTMNKRCLLDADIKSIAEKCNTLYETDYEFMNYIKLLNLSLEALALEIRQRTSEKSGKVYWALVNLQADDNLKTATHYNAKDIEYFSVILRELVESKDGTLSSTNVLNLVSTVKRNMTRSEAAEACDAFVRDAWFERDRERSISLAPRGFMELSVYMKAQFPDSIHECGLCQNICLVGGRCQNGDCDARLHNGCLKIYKNNLGINDPKCFTCQTPWSAKLSKTAPANARSKRSYSQSFNENNQSNRSAVVVEEEEEDEEDEDEEEDTEQKRADESEEEEEPNPTPVQNTRKSRRTRQ